MIFYRTLMKEEAKRTLLALVPLVVLVVLLALDIAIYGADSILGASQVSLLAAAGICILLSMCFHKTPWKTFEKAVAENLGDVATAIVIEEDKWLHNALFPDKPEQPK